MNIIKFTLASFFLVVASGCAVQAIMSPEALREYVGEGGLLTARTTFTVERNYTKVGETFTDRSAACLKDRAVTNYHIDSKNGSSSVTNRYTSRVEKKNNRVELYVQISQGGMRLYDQPDGGAYSIVADATPVAKNETRVDIYHQKYGHGLLVTAIKNWAHGKQGCPDLTKM